MIEMQASELATATWVNMAGATSYAGNSNTSAGTMIMPPPMPNRPAHSPAIAPTAANAGAMLKNSASMPVC